MRNKKKLLYFITIGIILIILGLVCDCLIKSGIFQYYLVVNENYIVYIFFFFFTVATLGCTLLSIIVGVSSNRVLGLQLREIVSLKNSPLKLNTMIIGSMIIVGISVPALAFELTTSITILRFPFYNNSYWKESRKDAGILN